MINTMKAIVCNFLLIYIMLFLYQVGSVLSADDEMENSYCESKQNSDSEIIFSSCDNGLPWPIEDFNSISVLITHGIHCIQIIQKVNKCNEYHRFHQEHCLGLMREIYEFFKENTDYSVPDELCRDFRLIAFPGRRIRRGLWGGWRGKRETVQQHGLTSQGIHFKTRATRNFELLLLKEKRGLPLSRIEKEYLDGSRAPQTIRMAALGIFCEYEGYVGVVSDLIHPNRNVNKPRK